MIAGPSNFPVERMRKKGDAVHRRLNEMLEWDSKARERVKREVLDAAPQSDKDEKEFRGYINDFASSLATVRAIDSGAAFYTRSAFTNSIAGKIERLAGNGRTELVRRLLDWLRERNSPEGGKPAFTDRHKVWTFGRTSEAASASLAENADRSPELIGQFGEIELWADYPEERVKLLFPGKPSEGTRELLKSSGWNWSPTNGAWQRRLTANAMAAGKAIIEHIAKAGKLND